MFPLKILRRQLHKIVPFFKAYISFNITRKELKILIMKCHKLYKNLESIRILIGNASANAIHKDAAWKALQRRFLFRFLRNETVLLLLRCELFTQWGLLSNQKNAGYHNVNTFQQWQTTW